MIAIDSFASEAEGHVSSGEVGEAVPQFFILQLLTAGGSNPFGSAKKGHTAPETGLLGTKSEPSAMRPLADVHAISL